MRMTVHTTPRIIIILQFFHQYFLFSLAALVSNCEAPACNASARLSSSDSFWSLSSTLSTFILMMSTTSSTRACVCCSRLLLDTLVPGGSPAAPALVGPWVGAGADMACSRAGAERLGVGCLPLQQRWLSGSAPAASGLLVL